MENDDCFRLLRVFHERVTAATPIDVDASARILRRAHLHEPSRRAVVSNITEWGDMADGRKWTWWSLWSPRQLEAFSSVTFMANGFDKSVTFKMLKGMHPDIEWIEVPLQSSRIFKPRTVRIEYFAEKHQASQSLFDTDEGKANLRAIARHLSSRSQIWMANDRHAAELVGMGGHQLRPHQAGSNQFAHYDNAACIYAAKPSAETRAVMRFLNVDPDAWTHSYEFEAILQFVARTSIRNPDSSATVTLTVYDKDQADYLADYFNDQSHCTVEVHHVDLQLTDENRTRGRKAMVLSVDEAIAKQELDKTKRAAAARLRRSLAKEAK